MCSALLHGMSLTILVHGSNIAAIFQVQGYITFFMLNSTEHGISFAHKPLNTKKIETFYALIISCYIYPASKC